LVSKDEHNQQKGFEFHLSKYPMTKLKWKEKMEGLAVGLGDRRQTAAAETAAMPANTGCGRGRGKRRIGQRGKRNEGEGSRGK